MVVVVKYVALLIMQLPVPALSSRGCRNTPPVPAQASAHNAIPSHQWDGKTHTTHHR